MSDRQLILEAIQEMPETASFQEIVDELLLMDTVQERLEKRIPEGKGVPAEELLRQVSSMGYKVIWTDEAIADLRQSVVFISQDNSPSSRR